jgi:nitroreductase family protein
VDDSRRSTAGLAYTVAHDLVVRQSLVDPSSIQLSWRGGAERRELTIQSARLAGWLVEAVAGPIPVLAGSAADALEMALGQASSVVNRLRRLGLLVPIQERDLEAERCWRRFNLHDALVINRSARSGRRQSVSRMRGAIGRREAGEPDDDGDPGSAAGDIAARRVPLPPVSDRLTRCEFFRALHGRRTTRDFSGTRIGLSEVSEVLAWGARPLLVGSPNRLERDAEQTGLLAIYVLFDREKMPAELRAHGLTFRYDAPRHALTPVRGTVDRVRLSELVSEQDFVDGAPVMLALAINWPPYMRSGSPDMYVKAHLDVGAAMQRILLVATALTLRTFITAAVDDARFEAVLGTDDSVTAPTHVVALGSG